MLNYGFVTNTISGDGEELDAYLVGIFEPVEEYKGEVIAIIKRTNDNDDKLIVAPENKYNSNKLIDMKLLYVAMTRALHELKVLYKNEVSVPLKSEIGNKTQSKIR